jgi:hypothetical protein
MINILFISANENAHGRPHLWYFGNDFRVALPAGKGVQILDDSLGVVFCLHLHKIDAIAQSFLKLDF